MQQFTPRAQQVLALARKEAQNFKHNYIGTEHILLGIIKLGQGVAVNVLRKMGVNLENVSAEIERIVGKGASPESASDIQQTQRVKKFSHSLRTKPANCTITTSAPSTFFWACSAKAKE